MNPARLRIGHVLTALWPGGIERFVLTLSESLPPARYELLVYAWMANNPWKGEFEARGIRVIELGAPNRLRSLSDLIRMALAWLRLCAALRDDRIDIVQTHDFLPSMVGRTASILAGVPVRISTLHNLYDWWPSWVFACNRLLARSTDAIVCVSESVKNYFVRREGLSPERYTTILNAADGRRFRPDPQARAILRNELGIHPHEILIGSVGSVTTRKAQHLLVEAAARLKRDGHPIQVRIWGANLDNPQHDETRLRGRIRELDLENQVQILAPRPDIEAAYAAMDIHCMTSIAEGLSLASVEAILSGALAVYSDIGPFREVVEEGRTGFLFRSGDAADLARILEHVILRLPDLQSLRERARRHAIEQFTTPRLAMEWADLYNKTAKG